MFRALLCLYDSHTLVHTTPQDDTWRLINADQSVDALHAELKAQAVAVIDAAGDKVLRKLWLPDDA